MKVKTRSMKGGHREGVGSREGGSREGVGSREGGSREGGGYSGVPGFKVVIIRRSDSRLTKCDDCSVAGKLSLQIRGKWLPVW